MSKFNRLIIFLVIGIAFASYAFYLNPHPITINLTRSWSIGGPAAILLMVIFLLGMGCAAFIAFFFTIPRYFRERALEARERERERFFETYMAARSYLISGEWRKAQDLWQKLIDRDPTDVIARVELSRSYEQEGDLKSALKILDAARVAEPHSVEVLFRAADINIKLRNRTAAIDNLALILYHHPNKLAARMARDLSEELGRLEDAIEYQKHLDRLGGDPDESAYMHAYLQFQQILSVERESNDSLKRDLKQLLKRNSEFAPAYERLAEIEIREGNIPEGAKLLLQAGKVSGNVSYWREAAELWLANDAPERAIAAAKAAIHETAGSAAQIEAELNLVQLYIALNMLEEAQHSLDDLSERAHSSGLEVGERHQQRVLFLKGMCANRSGDPATALEVWKVLNQVESPDSEPPQRPAPRLLGAPSPLLSTP